MDKYTRNIPAKERTPMDWVRFAFPPNIEEDPISLMRERVWHRNILYYIGEQWISFDTRSGEFNRLYAGDASVPTPVSDIVGDTVSSLVALTLNKRFRTRIWPNSSEIADKRAAELGEHLLQYMDARDDYEVEDVKEMTELIRIITGNAFVRVYVADDDNWVFDAAGNRITKGEVYTDPILPMNVRVPTEGLVLRKKPWWAVQTLVSREWVEDTYGVLLPQASDDSRGNVAYQRQLMQLVAKVSGWKSAGLDMGVLDERDKDLVVLQEMEFKPCKSYPKGRYIAAAENTLCLDKSEMVIPIEGERSTEGIRWDYSLVHLPYRRQIGSMWSKDGVSPLISPQNIINEIDQCLAVNRGSLGRPYVITPAGITLRRLSDRQNKFLALEFDAKTTFGTTPQVHQGTPYPSQVLEERQQQREVAQGVSGDPKNVLRGDMPASSASGIMVDILRETAEQSHVPDIMRFYRGWNKVNRLRLRLAGSAYSEGRTLKVKGRGSAILVKQFRGSDLKGNTDVRFELDSGAASTNAGRNAFITRLIEVNFWPDLSQRPELRADLLRRFGLSGIQEVDNIHRKRAEMENAILVEGDKDPLRTVALPDPVIIDPETQTPALDEKGKILTYSWPYTFDPVFEHDPHDIHMMTHDEVIFGTEFRELDPEAKSRLLAHREMHQQALIQAMAEQIEADMLANVQAPGAMGSPPQPGPGAPAAGMGASTSNAPNPAGVSQALAGAGGGPPAGTGSGAAGMGGMP